MCLIQKNFHYYKFNLAGTNKNLFFLLKNLMEMPLSMVTGYNEIKQNELDVLQRQFEKSHFYLHKNNEKPTKLAIFDFDSTLFFSPLLSPTVWHPNLIRLATTESVYGPGWWRDIRSLDLGPFEELKKSAWEGYWNEKIVNEARECIQDPDTMTVVLTGRRYHPFHILIPHMLEAKKLNFDLIGLRPDPEVVSDNHWEVKQHRLSYNLSRSVFHSTMHFKTCFILNILHNLNSIQQVIMWDDRLPHVKRFREYLDCLVSKELIQEGSVVYVPGIRPKYNPTWEKNVVRHIIDTHNKALLDHTKNGHSVGKCDQLRWPIVEDPLGETEHIIRLTQLPAATIIKLSKDTTQALQEQFKPIFHTQLENNQKSLWKDLGGERIEFFGTCIYLSQNVIDEISIGSKATIKIKAYSDSPKIPCLLLLVEYDDKEYMLPLWYKPSEYNDIFRLKDTVHWQTIETDPINGVVDYEYRLGIKDEPVSKRRRYSRDSTNAVKRSKV